MTILNTTGTIAATNGSANIVGSGTNWVAAGVAGGTLFVAGGSYPIASVNSDTSITLAIPFAGATGSGLAYAIAVEQQILAQTTHNANRLAVILDDLAPLAGYTTFSNDLMENVNAGQWRDDLELGSAATEDLPAKTTADRLKRLSVTDDGNGFELLPRKKKVWLTTGQSNGANWGAATKAWSKNFKIWNWNGLVQTATDVGTAFIDPNPTKVNVFWQMVEDYAAAHPDTDCYLINISIGGLPIIRWDPASEINNMYLAIKANVEAALAVLGLDHIDEVAFWQGESDAAAGAAWLTAIDALHDNWRAEDWFPYHTPMLMFGISILIGEVGAFGQTFNPYVIEAVNRRPDVRMYVHPAVFPVAFWDPSGAAPYIHMNPDGYEAAGHLAYFTRFGGVGRSVQPGVITDPETGNVGILGRPSTTVDVAMRRNKAGVTSGLINNLQSDAAASAQWLVQTLSGNVSIVHFNNFNIGRIAASGALQILSTTGALSFFSNNTLRGSIESAGAINWGAFSATGASNGKKIGLDLLESSRDTASSIGHLRFFNPNGLVGTISTNGSATAYGTSSDYRLKVNVAPMDGAIDRLMQLRPVWFNWISNPDGAPVDGFIAHEVQEVVPGAIIGEKDGCEEIGTAYRPGYVVMGKVMQVVKPNGDVEEVAAPDEHVPDDKIEDILEADTPEGYTWEKTATRAVHQAIDQAKLVPLLTKALQEAVERIEALELRLGTGD